MKCNMRNLIRLGFHLFTDHAALGRTSGHINIAQLDALHLTLIRKDDQLGSIPMRNAGTDNFIQDQIHCLHTLGAWRGFRNEGYRIPAHKAVFRCNQNFIISIGDHRFHDRVPIQQLHIAHGFIVP